jgi:hypothetical protein
VALRCHVSITVVEGRFLTPAAANAIPTLLEPLPFFLQGSSPCGKKEGLHKWYRGFTDVVFLSSFLEPELH